ncbi:hypothetical protein [Pseudomonas sp. Pseu.R1]|uniref:hypothetical protein n=1 Tax=Pseudomonas sp. Pseu.R1 TaxID=3379818 RepID=UPI003B928176
MGKTQAQKNSVLRELNADGTEINVSVVHRCLYGRSAAGGECSAAIKKWKIHFELFFRKVINGLKVGKVCAKHDVLGEIFPAFGGRVAV